jgi:hypothetical protein
MKPKTSLEVFVRNPTNCRPSLHASILSSLPKRDDAGDLLRATSLVIPAMRRITPMRVVSLSQICEYSGRRKKIKENPSALLAERS